MRWFRLLILGLACVYPLYWTSQFLLFFVPESLMGFWLGDPIQVISISYLQAMATVQPRAVFPALWEALVHLELDADITPFAIAAPQVRRQSVRPTAIRIVAPDAELRLIQRHPAISSQVIIAD